MPSSASTAIETLALVFWSFQLLPQVWLNVRRSSAAGLSATMMLSWSIGSLATAISVIAAGYPTLFIVQPNVFLLFSIVAWAQCTYYTDNGDTDARQRSKRKGVLFAAVAFVLIAAVEAVLSLLLLHSSADRNASGSRYLDTAAWPFVLLSVLSMLLFIVGFVPQYREIYADRCVQGVSRLFLSIDMAGAVLSTIALTLLPSFQGIAAGTYISVFVLDAGIMLLSLCLPAPPPPPPPQLPPSLPSSSPLPLPCDSILVSPPLPPAAVTMVHDIPKVLIPISPSYLSTQK